MRFTKKLRIIKINKKLNVYEMIFFKKSQYLNHCVLKDRYHLIYQLFKF